ncbi:2TM domain-containing protein [Thermoleophilia bacterium SCSIO 60948]|nr:2TM domain-containing protein [Thermoleophilia bacterium SCSIO 60948]
MTDTTESPERTAARKRIEARRAFKTTAISFVVVWIVLIAIWALTTPDGYFWPVWPIGGMAIGLGFQALGLKGNRAISEDEIDREMQRG